MRHAHANHVHSVVTALRAAAYPATRAGAAGAVPTGPPRFITISRQAGAGGTTLATDLADALNRLDPGPQPWTVWDHELVDKVSAEHQIPEALVDALEDADRPWFREFVESLSSAHHYSDFEVYRRVALTIRALAAAGRTVIVGRGGVFVTAGMPGGVHVRLVAPVDYRVGRMAERHRISPEEAAVRVRETDRNRAAFYRRYWPGRDVAPETFTATLNTAALTDRQMVACLLPLACDGGGGVRPADDPPRPAGEASAPATTRMGLVRGGAV